MPISLDPSTLRLQAGQLIVSLAMNPNRFVRGISRAFETKMNRDTAVVRVERLGPPPNAVGPLLPSEHTGLAPHASLGRSFGGHEGTLDYEWREGPESAWRQGWPWFVGQLLLIPRDVPLVVDHGDCRYLLIDATEVMISFGAPLEEVREAFEVIPWAWGKI